MTSGVTNILKSLCQGPQELCLEDSECNDHEKTTRKVSGITINYATSKLNFDSIEDMILGNDVPDVITVSTEWKIKLRREGSMVLSRLVKTWLLYYQNTKRKFT
jgi:hypothetical protein